jgi:hypothetical protein
MVSHLGHWIEVAKDVLFGLEFLLVQVYLIYHIIRALFVPKRPKRAKQSLRSSKIFRPQTAKIASRLPH